LSVRLWAPAACAGAAMGGAVRALWARPLAVPGKALRPRWPAGYQARLRRPENAVLGKTTHPLNIIDFTIRFVLDRTRHVLPQSILGSTTGKSFSEGGGRRRPSLPSRGGRRSAGAEGRLWRRLLLLPLRPRQGGLADGGRRRL